VHSRGVFAPFIGAHGNPPLQDGLWHAWISSSLELFWRLPGYGAFRARQKG
jgi:hypothetical protein